MNVLHKRRFRRSPIPGLCVARVFPALLTLGLLAPAALAQEDHEGPAIAFDEQLTLHDLAQAARERHPDRGVLDARQRRASAEDDYSGRWFPESSLLRGYHLSDRAFDDVGLYEDEIAVSLPLWMPGERKSRSNLAEALSSSTVSGEAEFNWRVSSELREALWKLVAARRQWELAGEQEANLAKVLEQAVIFEEAGEISKGDRLAVLQELATWKAETMSLEAQYQDAARTFRALTGAGSLPADFTEELSTMEKIREDHPALRMARDQMQELSAAVDAMRQGNNYRPSLQLFWRGQRPDQASSQLDSVGIGFEVPLGRSPSRGPEIALVNEALAQAEAHYLRQQRELGLQLHEAEHTLHTTELQLANSYELINAAEERRGLDQLALELGEISVQEWLRRLSGYKTIQRTHELLLLQKGAAIAAYNQAVGETL
jgi:outer membrane protein TolC